MALSSPSDLPFASHGTDLFNVTVTSSLIQAVMTEPSVKGGDLGHGCLVVARKLDPQDNPDNIVSRQTHLWISTFSYMGLVPILFLVGVPGNILSAAVFYRLGLRERINFCVFSQAIVDLVVIVVIFCLSMEKMYRSFVGPFGFFIKYFVGLTGFTWVSMFLSAVIAAERCFCVVSPLRAQRMLSTRTLAVTVISTSAVILTGMLVVAGPKHTEACVFNPLTNATSFIVYVTQYYRDNKVTLDVFDIFIYATALPIIFFVVVVVTTVMTAVKLRTASRWRQQSSSAPGAQKTGSLESHMVALTRMLIATSVLFVACMSPVVAVQITIFLVPELKSAGRFHNFRTLLWSSIDVLRCVNSSLNFFVYCQMGSRFRLTLKQLLPCKMFSTTTVSSAECVDSASNIKHGRETVTTVS